MSDRDSEIQRCIEEQSSALEHLNLHGENKLVRLWLEDWFAEEVLIRTEERE